VYPHQLVVGRKDSCHIGNYAGPNCEYGLTTAAGLTVDRTVEHAMRDHYFLGVATTEVPYGGDTMYGSDPIGEAFSFLRSGTVSVRWYDNEDGKPGDLVSWTIPPLQGDVPGKSKKNQGFSYDDGFNPLSKHMYGEASFDNPIYYAKKFDPTDFGMQLAASFWALDKDKSAGGIANVTFAEFQNTDMDLSSIQEEACGWVFGLIGVLKCLSPTQLDILRDFVVTKPINENNPGVKDAFGSIFGKYTFGGDNNSTKPATLKPEDKTITDDCMKLLTGSITSAAYAKGERVIGKLLNGVRPGDDADLMLQHVKLGF
jgi:hypothetical protein